MEEKQTFDKGKYFFSHRVVHQTVLFPLLTLSVSFFFSSLESLLSHVIHQMCSEVKDRGWTQTFSHFPQNRLSKHPLWLNQKDGFNGTFWTIISFSQRTSPKEETGSGPWLPKHSTQRQPLTQEGQWGAHCSPHTGTQVITMIKTFNLWLFTC